MCNNLCIIYKNYIVYHQKYWALTNAYNGTIIILVFTSEIIFEADNETISMLTTV